MNNFVVSPASTLALSILGATGISLLSFAPASALVLVEPIITTQNDTILNGNPNATPPLLPRVPRVLGPQVLPGQPIEFGVPDVANNLQNATENDMASLVFELTSPSSYTFINYNANPPFPVVTVNEEIRWGDVNGDGKIGFFAADLYSPSDPTFDPNLKDIFTKVTCGGQQLAPVNASGQVFCDSSVLTFSGSAIPNGTVFFNRFFSSPNLAPGGGIIPAIPPSVTNRDGPIRVSSLYRVAPIPEPASVLGLLGFGVLGLSLRGKKKQ